jgi:hypothetical protein
MSTEKPIGHAPGVLCIVNVPSQWPESVDNRKIVELIECYPAYGKYRCRNCGKLSSVSIAYAPVWSAKGAGLYTPCGTFGAETAYAQRHLIPLGDSSLLDSDELTMEQQHIIDAFDKVLPDRMKQLEINRS